MRCRSDHAARKAVTAAVAGKPIVIQPLDSCRELICSKLPAGVLWICPSGFAQAALTPNFSPHFLHLGIFREAFPRGGVAMVFTFPSSSAALPVVGREAPAAAAVKWHRPVAAFVLVFAAVWLSLYAAYVLLSFTRPGSVVIADAKFETLVKGNMFGPQDRNRVMIFGHSKVLTSVRPSQLDAAVGPGFRSYNLGLPGEVRFLPILEAALQAGNIPTHVLLTLPWDAKPDKDGLIDALRNDSAIAATLFPFRSLPRDMTLFVFENRRRLPEAVRDVAAQRERMLEDRGWYFVKSQSHYADDRLPDDYVLPTDHPAQTDVRSANRCADDPP
jgi:hypothetical protein